MSVKSTAKNIAKGAKSAGKATGKGAKSASNAAVQKAKLVGGATAQNAKVAGTAVTQGSEVARGAVVQGAKSVGDATMRAGKVAGDTATQKAKLVGGATAQNAKVAGGAVSQGSEVARGAVVQGAKSAGDAATRVGRPAVSAANHGVIVAGSGLGAIGRSVPWDSVFPERVRNSLMDAIESSNALSVSAKRNLAAQLGPTLHRLSESGVGVHAQAFGMVQALLAHPQISRDINGWLQSLVEGSATIYDQAMDVNSAVGGNYHRLFDGNHTLVGAFQAVRDASPDDSIFEEAVGLLQALARDGTTPRGLPLVTWDEDTFNGLAGTLGNFGISKSWLNDLVSYDAVELAASSISILPLLFNWNSKNIEEFSDVVGSMGVSAAVSANPLMIVVSVVALARAFHMAKRTGDWSEFADGLSRGGICTGAVLLSASFVPGPTFVVLLANICVSILVSKATKNVSFTEVSQFVLNEMRGKLR